MQAASLKDKWGLGYKPSYNRSKSISAAAGRPTLKRIERQRSAAGKDGDPLYAVAWFQMLPHYRNILNIWKWGFVERKWTNNLLPGVDCFLFFELHWWVVSEFELIQEKSGLQLFKKKKNIPPNVHSCSCEHYFKNLYITISFMHRYLPRNLLQAQIITTSFSTLGNTEFLFIYFY